MTAEERAYNYASTIKASKFQVGEIVKFYNDGYNQAKKNLELSWEDIKTIDKLLNQCVDYSNPYQEVLKRFKAQKGE